MKKEDEILLELLDIVIELERLRDNLNIIGCAACYEPATPREMIGNAVFHSVESLGYIIRNIENLEEIASEPDESNLEA